MNNLSDITIDDWSNLANDYVKTNACLMVRIIGTRKYHINEEEKIRYIDDMFDNVFQVTGINQRSNLVVPELVGYYKSISQIQDNLSDKDYITFKWNPRTYSWSEDGIEGIGRTMICRRYYYHVYNDVPVGHIYSNTIEAHNKISDLYFVKFSTLGSVGTKMSISYPESLQPSIDNIVPLTFFEKEL